MFSSVTIPWFHFFLLELCVQMLGSLLPVKIPILSSIPVLQVNSLILYQALLLYKNKRLNFDEKLQCYTWKLARGKEKNAVKFQHGLFLVPCIQCFVVAFGICSRIPPFST
uniref:Uncharacterized protein n=1 Tax=Crocodylus porosus TaxID=8502 RepID=A0A7M4FX07_CROPO